MKTNHYLTITLLVLSSFLLMSDIAPDGGHYVSRNSVITNISEFPEIAFIGYVTGVMPPDNILYIIEENEPLPSIYKFNILNIFGIERTLLNEMGGLDSLSEDFINQSVDLNPILSSNNYHVSNYDLIERDDIYYEIEKTENGSYRAVLIKRVLEFKRGKNKTIDY